MQRPLLTLLVLAALVSSAFAASVFQLDVCNKHRTVSEAPGTSLTVTKDGLCVVTSQVLTVPAGGARSCSASKTSTAVLLRFPCREEPRLKQASGPALNVWGSFEGIPQPSRQGVIVNEAASAKKQSLHAAKLAGATAGADGYVVTSPESYVVSAKKAGRANADDYVVSAQQAGSPDGYVVSGKDGYIVSGNKDGYVVSNAKDGYVVSAQNAGSKDSYIVSGNKDGYVVSTQSAGGYVVSTAGSANGTGAAQVGACSFLTLNPGLYYHKSPPMLTYGYAVSGVPCERAASALAVTGALDRAGAKTFPTTYSLWLKPTLPAPPAGMSAEPQQCNLVVSVLQRSYVSTDKFPCSMRTLTPEELDDGCCYNAGGMGRRLLGSLWAGRNLLSSWEKAVWNRRAMLH